MSVDTVVEFFDDSQCDPVKNSCETVFVAAETQQNEESDMEEQMEPTTRRPPTISATTTTTMEACSLSLKVGTNQRSLLHQKQDEDGISDHICAICSQSFQKRYLLMYHLRNHSGQYSFTCQTCQTGFVLLKSLVMHQRLFHLATHLCKRCGLSCDGDEALSCHVCIEIKPFVCEGCGFGFMELTTLANHSKNCKDYSFYSPTLREYQYCYKGGYNCHTCQLEFTILSRLIDHRLRHHSGRSSVTSSCTYTDDIQVSTENTTGSINEVTATELAPVEKSCRVYNIHRFTNICPFCGIEYFSRYYYLKHIKIKHGSSVIKSAFRQSCEFCGKSFDGDDSLRHHVQSQHPFQNFGNVPYQCDLSGSYCRNERHLNHHSTLNQYQVNSQDTTIKQSTTDYHASLESYADAPLEENKASSALEDVADKCVPFNCDKCGLFFSTKFSLKLHTKQRHPPSGESCTVYQPIVADPPLEEKLYCARLAELPDSTSNEMAAPQTNILLLTSDAKDLSEVVLTPEKRRFKCDLCPKVYQHRDSLGRHRRSIHKNFRKALPKQKIIITPVAGSSQDQLAATTVQSTTSIDTVSLEVKRRFKCDLCPKVYQHRDNLGRHRRIIHSIRKYHKALPKQKLLTVPAAGSSQDQLTATTVCAEQSSTSIDTISLEVNKCELCPKVYQHHNSLGRHRRNIHRKYHTKQKIITTPSPASSQDQLASTTVCAEQSTTSIDTVKGGFKCDQCPKVYQHRDNLGRHRRKIHRKYHKALPEQKLLTPVACSSQDQPTATPQHLVDTDSVDTASVDVKKRFKCDLCPKAYKRHDHLNRHKKEIHLKTYAKTPSGDRLNLSCQQTADKIEEHEKVMPHQLPSLGHSLKTHKCDLCPKVYQSHRSMTRHRENKHLVKSKTYCTPPTPPCNVEEEPAVKTEEGSLCHYATAKVPKQDELHSYVKQANLDSKNDEFPLLYTQLEKTSLSDSQTKLKLFFCSECNKVYKRHDTLREHRSQIHNTGTAPASCSFVKKSWSGLSMVNEKV